MVVLLPVSPVNCLAQVTFSLLQGRREHRHGNAQGEVFHVSPQEAAPLSHFRGNRLVSPRSPTPCLHVCLGLCFVYLSSFLLVI